MAELSDLTAQCIRCGFCLETCPTFVITGKETESPRGRIYLARSMDEGVLPWALENRGPLDTCVGCRACETACPSGVQYGKILELTRERLVQKAPGRKDFWQLALLRLMTTPGLLRVALGTARFVSVRKTPGWMSRLVSSGSAVALIPTLPDSSDWQPLDDSVLPAIKGEVALLEGCAMGVLYPHVHEATERLLRRIGFRAVRVKGCCGALHAHAGYLQNAHVLSQRIFSQMSPGTILLTNSAGCGCWLKESQAVGIETFDVCEFLIENGLARALDAAPGLSCGDRSRSGGSLKKELVGTYHQACHLAHGQGVRELPVELLKHVKGLHLVPLTDSDMCCGSGGVYNLLQPEHARKMLDRKWENVVDTGASVVITGNPGCHAWIAQAASESGGNVQVLHTVTVLESAFSGSLP